MRKATIILHGHFYGLLGIIPGEHRKLLEAPNYGFNMGGGSLHRRGSQADDHVLLSGASCCSGDWSLYAVDSVLRSASPGVMSGALTRWMETNELNVMPTSASDIINWNYKFTFREETPDPVQRPFRRIDHNLNPTKY